MKALRGEGLKSKKWRPFHVPYSNPYIQASFQDKWNGSPVEQRTLEPEWNFELLDMERVTSLLADPLKVSVFNRNRLFPDNFMGRVCVPANKLYALGTGPHTYWFELLRSDKRRYRRETVSGRILLHFDIEVRHSQASRIS